MIDGANEVVVGGPLLHSATAAHPPMSIPSLGRDLSRRPSSQLASSAPFLLGWADLGSEVGEPLFARIVDKTGGNREHITNAGAAAAWGGASILADYRHAGNYTDRYEAFWSAYRREHGTTSPYTDLGDHGLANYYLVAWRLRGERVRTHGHAARYEHWWPTPYFFTPLFRKGIRLEQRWGMSVGAYEFGACLGMDTEDRYLDHQSPTDYDNLWAEYGVTREFARGLEAGLTARLATDAVPGVAAAVHLGGGPDGKPGWRARLGSYEDGSAFGSAELTLGDRRDLTFAIRGAVDYVPRREAYVFLTVDDTVHYRYTSYHTLRLGSMLSWPGTTALPLSGEIWADHDHRSAWEWVDTAATVNTVENRPAEAPISRLGAALRYRCALGPFSAAPWARGRVAAGSRPQPLSLPWSAGMDLGLGRLTGDMPGVKIVFETVGPVSVAYHVGSAGETETHSIPERFQLSGECRLPFILPSWAGMLDSVFRIRVSPIHLSGPSRRKHHPMGSEMGPVILCTLEGNVAGRGGSGRGPSDPIRR